jgi:hypothetical protein
MKNIFKVISIIIVLLLAVLGIMFVLDLVGGTEMKNLIIKILEIGGILLLVSLVLTLISKSDSKA